MASKASATVLMLALQLQDDSLVGDERDLLAVFNRPSLHVKAKKAFAAGSLELFVVTDNFVPEEKLSLKEKRTRTAPGLRAARPTKGR